MMAWWLVWWLGGSYDGSVARMMARWLVCRRPVKCMLCICCWLLLGRSVCRLVAPGTSLSLVSLSLSFCLWLPKVASTH